MSESQIEQLTLLLCAICMVVVIASSLVIKGTASARIRRIAFGFIVSFFVLLCPEVYKIYVSAALTRERSAPIRSLLGHWKVYASDSVDFFNLSINSDGTASFSDTHGTWAITGSGKSVTITEVKGDAISREQQKHGATINGQAIFNIENPSLLRWAITNNDGRSVSVLTARKSVNK
jgi:hypothetical protein